MTTATTTDTTPAPQTPAQPEEGRKKNKAFGVVRARFNEVSALLKPDKGFQPAAIVSGILLGTTALVTPLLGSMVGAGLGLGLGLYLLTKTGDIVVENTAALGKKAGISSMALGVGLGILTSLPELFVSVAALSAGDAGIAVSNITGSNIANLMLILGSTAVINKVKSHGTSWKFNTAVMLGATGIMGAQIAMGVLNPVAGAAMLGALGFYLWKSYKLAQKDAAQEKADEGKTPAAPTAEEITAAAEKAKKDAAAAEEEKNKPEMKAPKWLNIVWGAAGVAGLVGAAAFTVSSAVAFGAAAGISSAVVGILAVSVGTSLPELIVNIKAARKGDTDLAVGNVMGSNIFNIMAIGGLLSLTGTALPAALNPKQTILGLFNTLAFGGSALLAAATMAKTKGEIGKKTGFLWLGLYAAFTAVNAVLGRTPGPEAGAIVPPATPPAPVPPPGPSMF